MKQCSSLTANEIILGNRNSNLKVVASNAANAVHHAWKTSILRRYLLLKKPLKEGERTGCWNFEFPDMVTIGINSTNVSDTDVRKGQLCLMTGTGSEYILGIMAEVIERTSVKIFMGLSSRCEAVYPTILNRPCRTSKEQLCSKPWKRASLAGRDEYSFR